MLRLAEDDCADAQAAAPWSLQGALDLHLRLRGLQSGAHAKPRGRSSCGVSRGPKCVPMRKKIALGASKALRINFSDTKMMKTMKDRTGNYVRHSFFSSLLEHQDRVL